MHPVCKSSWGVASSSFQLESIMSAATVNTGDQFATGLSFSLEKLGIPDITLKEEQRLAIYGGRDVFVWLPTGYGKSLCYQTIPFLMDHKLGLVSASKSSTVLVVSPLVSLIIDQVQNLRKRGVKSSILTSTSAVSKEFLATDESLTSDSLLFCAPEAISMSKWRDALENQDFSGRIVSVVVDEAHCISKW